MREIKFRAWVKGSSGAYSWDGYRMLYPRLDLTSIKDHFDLSDFTFSDGEYDGNFHHAEEVMQFTGLHDKNGKEIYEGDIFQDDEDGSCEFVEWDSEFGGWTTQMWYSVGEFAQCARELEVIGNIYEHSHLLQK